MSSVAVDAIGVVGSALGIWSFGADNLPKMSQDSSAYRVQVGLDGTKDGKGKSLSNAGGKIDQIKTYNNNGELIGSGKGGGIEDGGHSDFTALQKGSQQAITTEFYAADDAVCIAYISATMDDDSQWGWVGDWGYTCGMPWFPSGYKMQSSGGNDDKVEAPRCTWVDKDHTNDYPVGVIAINWPDFYHKDGEAKPSGDGRKYCGSSFRAWGNEGGDQLLPIKKEKLKRNKRRSQRSDHRLVVSSLEGHNATEVCHSETSWGPDFISLAGGDGGLYCNMETHEVLPLCDDVTTQDCFSLHGEEGPAIVSRLGKRSPRNPTKVIRWE